MARVGVLLSGCGVQDGSEIYEAVLTLLALERAGAVIVATAPDVEQAHIINHYTGEETRLEARNVMTEAARIVRGKITSTREISAHDIDALIIIGGFGAVKNLCSFAIDGANATVHPDAERLIRDLNGLGKPIGAMCAASVVVALALKDKQPVLTMGSDDSSLSKLGLNHTATTVEQVVVDEANSLVSTAAFMLAEGPAQAESGINKLVEHVLQMANALAGVSGGTLHNASPRDTVPHSTSTL